MKIKIWRILKDMRKIVTINFWKLISECERGELLFNCVLHIYVSNLDYD